MKQTLPFVRKDQFTIQPMGDEVLVYDIARARANVLNHPAAVIFGLCDGQTNVTDIAARASRELNMPVDEKFVWFTLSQLSNKNLLQETGIPSHWQGMTRRDFLRAGIAGAAVVLPVIVTLAAPPAARAASCTASGQACGSGTECCSTICTAGFCE